MPEGIADQLVPQHGDGHLGIIRECIAQRERAMHSSS